MTSTPDASPSLRKRLMTLVRDVLPEAWRPEHYLIDLVREKTGLRVAQGPFAGMRYVPESIGSTYAPKLLGTYERELYPTVEQALALRPERVVDIGAAEGFYAVGLAMRLPGVPVHAFEMDIAGRNLLAQMAALNGVEAQVQVYGKCEVDDLRVALGSGTRSLVVCDVEGYEAVLLDPAEVPALAAAHILVELHEFARPGVAALLESRFAATHTLTRIWAEDRTAAEFPYSTAYTRLLPAKHLLIPLAEDRPERMSWWWMAPRG